MSGQTGAGRVLGDGRAGAVDPEVFRDVMASVPTPVAVVTTVVEGRPHGTTVSSFASLSLRPPMVLVALGQESELLRLLRHTNRFGVNVLSSGQRAVARAFARKDGDRFGEVEWAMYGGLPRLAGTAAWLACEVDGIVTGGDHGIAMGRVLDAGHSHLPPLTYHRRLYGTHTSLDGTD
ncbi:MAG TPA: flavin reductase family protein [Rugosimonospora sp.]|nr:flavin reductase family protein [Rugosimonospora sp.]